MDICLNCKKVLSADEIGLHKKIINRGSSEYMCIDCMSKHFNVSVKMLEEKIRQFKDMGCTLF